VAADPDADLIALLSLALGLMRGGLDRIQGMLRRGEYCHATAYVDELAAKIDELAAELATDDQHPRQDER
jgi:hypothetical protein